MSGTIRPARADLGSTAIGSNSSDSAASSSDGGGADLFRAELVSLQTGDDSPPPSARVPFEQRFSLDQPFRPTASFSDRFMGEIPASSAPVPSVVGLAPKTAAPAPVAAPPVPLPRAAARPSVAQAAQGSPKRPSEAGFRLASASSDTVLAYAPADPAKDPAGTGPLKDPTPKESDPLGGIDTSHTAIYDISARTVYLPNGRRLEAHSGLGGYMDDPRYVDAKGTGPTPPNVYELRARERIFHGVRAIRLIPTDESKMFGRTGMLAHSYMLGPNGQSNGCVSFNDYTAFLDAFDRGEITRLVVVERLADAPSPKTASDWIANTIKGLFRRS